MSTPATAHNDITKKRKSADAPGQPPSKKSRKGRRPTSEKEKPPQNDTAATPKGDGANVDKGKKVDKKNDSNKNADPHLAHPAGSRPNAQTPWPKPNLHKLPPRRPFPTVPTSSNATGPRSARAEGNNQFCISRKAPYAVYLRRCKEAVVNYGYRTLELSAMTAAIPTLLILAESIPETLPFSRDEIKIEYRTGTVKCVDEVLPGAEDEDSDTIQSELVQRNAASLSVVIRIGDGKKQISGHEKRSKRRKGNGNESGSGAKSIDDAMSTDDE